jgi:hypothetical protein
MSLRFKIISMCGAEAMQEGNNHIIMYCQATEHSN